MIKDLAKHITSKKPDIAWRFEDNEEVLENVKVVDKQTENLIWEKIKAENFIVNYSLNKGKFETLETMDFGDNYDLVTKKLKELPNTNDKIVLTWFSEQHTLVTDWKTFSENWDDFFYPSSDDLLVINENGHWIIYFAHFQSFQIGQGIKVE